MAFGKKTGGRNFSEKNQPQKRGRHRLPEDLRKANQLTKERLRGVINKYLWMTKDEMKIRLKHSSTPMIEVVIGGIIEKAAFYGDEKRMTFILDRMIGRVKEEIDINTYMKKLNDMTDSEVIELGKDALLYLQSANG